MGVLPPFLQDGKLHNICLVLEGYEEYYYFNRILDYDCCNTIVFQITASTKPAC